MTLIRSVSRRLWVATALLPLLLAACTTTSSDPPVARPTSIASPSTTASAPAASVPLTAARPSSSGGAVVAAAGDIACTPQDGAFKAGKGTPFACQQKATSDLILAMKPVAVLASGDLQYEVGRLADFQASYDKSWGRFKGITVPAPGNHEYGTGVTRGYFDYFGARAGTKSRSWFSKDIAGWHVVSLNSNCAQAGGCETGSAQERWLRADLTAHPAKCTIAIWHHPRWSSGLHGSSTKVDGLWRTLAQGGVDVAVVGHDHDYERFAPLDANGKKDQSGGLREFVVGTGGRSLYPVLGAAAGSEIRDFQTFGVLKLTLRPAAYSWEFVPVAGSTFTDSGSGSCH